VKVPEKAHFSEVEQTLLKVSKL